LRLAISAAVALVVLALAATASAGPFSALGPLDISAGDPYAGCPPIGAGVNYPDAEVEPFVGVNPTNSGNIMAVYQQDRYSNGGAKGIVSSASFDGGLTWLQRPVPADTVCTSGKYDRVRPLDQLRS
jgi:hypothetical protein